MGSIFFDVLFFIFGAVFGSFANVVIVRLPRKESIVFPNSRCLSCGASIAWYDNVPILSYFLLRGHCRQCGQPFSLRYPLVEFLMGLTFLLLFLKVGLSWFLLEYLIFGFGLITVTFIDLDHMILPDYFTLSGIVIGLVGGILNPERSFASALLGVLVGGGCLWAIAYAYWLLRHQEGMGGGDIKLLAWIGAVLGWHAIPFVILTSSILGSVVGIWLARKAKKGLQHTIPFGPYLALAALIYIFVNGESLSEWYLRLNGFPH